MRRALSINEVSYGKGHPRTAIGLSHLAHLLQATNRLAEAEPLMRRHLEIFVNFTRDTGHPHPHLRSAINNYGRLLIKMGDSQAQAQEKIEQILEPIRPR